MINKIELRSVKIAAFLSEETTAFQAAIYIDGKRAGEAHNDGHGGNTMVHLTNGQLPAVAAYARAHLGGDWRDLVRPDSSDFLLAEYLIDQLLDEHLAAKESARMARAEAKTIAKHAAKGRATARVLFPDGSRLYYGTADRSEKTLALVTKDAAKHAKKYGTPTEIKFVP